MLRSVRGWIRAALLGIAAASVSSAASAQDGDPKLHFSVTAGAMTENGINVVFNWDELNFAGSGFAGLAFGYERPLRDDRWLLGYELQLNHHFGNDAHQELAIPATLRFRPDAPWIRALDSYAVGFGLSFTSQTPQVEIDRRGVSQRTMIYMLYEAAFSVGESGDNVFFRLHHRSDGYGVFGDDSGSNAFALGYRKSF